ncbi:hypothetical protein [Phormidium sp. CCY1219]|uniref:hypothetical protein n=1 Tax=Phormidium sp. CCY1219 TaxID=2886104 RepID=UPI002D1EE697|nr:hypothetical protein [Phormidium sp. CCY1219]MEB3829036.1 hypothetical protein [Phormidium sp. CCY1219]
MTISCGVWILPGGMRFAAGESLYLPRPSVCFSPVPASPSPLPPESTEASSGGFFDYND